VTKHIIVPAVIVLVICVVYSTLCNNQSDPDGAATVASVANTTMITAKKKNHRQTRSIRKMLGPFATASRRTPIHQVSLLSHARIDVHDNDDANNNNNDNA